MRDDEATILYQVVLSGDQWDHERFRETVHETGGEIEAERNMADVPVGDGEMWAELAIQEDGIGVTLYRKPAGPGIEVVDEMWFTNDEMSEMRSTDGLSKVILDATE